MFFELTLYLIIFMSKRHIYSQACIASIPWDTVSNQSLAVWKLGQEQNIDGNEFAHTEILQSQNAEKTSPSPFII